MSAAEVQAYLDRLPDHERATVDALRALVAASRSGLNERIKWNGPSFPLGEEDRITLGLMPKGGVRVVLHRGAKAKDSADFDFEDPDGLASWPSSDRGVLTFHDVGSVTDNGEKLQTLFTRWLEATS